MEANGSKKTKSKTKAKSVHFAEVDEVRIVQIDTDTETGEIVTRGDAK